MNIRYDFGSKITAEFLKQCKVVGVSCHVAFFTATQLAILNLLQETDEATDECDITSNHTINARRYWDKNIDAETLFCSSIALLPTKFRVHLKSNDNFWNTCLQYGEVFYSEIKRLTALKKLFHMMESTDASQGEMEAGQMRPSRYYDTTNVGDVTDIITGNFALQSETDIIAEKDKRVIVTDFYRTTSTHGGGNPCSQVLQSFKGRLLYSLDYNVPYMSTKTAEKYIHAIVDVITHAVSNYNKK